MEEKSSILVKSHLLLHHFISRYPHLEHHFRRFFKKILSLCMVSKYSRAVTNKERVMMARVWYLIMDLSSVIDHMQVFQWFDTMQKWSYIPKKYKQFCTTLDFIASSLYIWSNLRFLTMDIMWWTFFTEIDN